MDGIRHERSPKRVRVYLGGVPVADTTQALLVWEIPYYPTYYIPAGDVDTDLLVETGTVTSSPDLGDARHFTVKAGDQERVDAAVQYAGAPDEAVRGAVRFEWEAMDGWFEEDEEVFTHPRSPYHRVDILASSRRVTVSIGGVDVVDSTNARVLFETSLPPRWYVPKLDVRMDLLVPSDKVTHCPYKGQAQYWSVQAGDRLVHDVAWSYRAPFAESQKVAGLVCFYNERVDMAIDGVSQPRPRSPFSED